jgi:hypothetical protein
MDRRHPDSGPAFPFVVDHGDKVQAFFGMSMRDWFAGQALNACYDRVVRTCAVEGWPENWRYSVAQEAYQMADAMLKAREEK